MEFFASALGPEELRRRVGHMSQIAGVRLLTSDDGPSRGVRLLEFTTGTGFRFEVAIDRGFDVGRCDYRGASAAWIPPTLLPAPWFFEDQSGFGWLRAGLGGFNNTCGLVHIGNPEEADVGHYNFPARPTDRYGVHDRAALIPAEIVGFGGRWEGDRYVLEAVGRVTQAQTYGENLVMTRTYRSELGASWFTMEDVVENAVSCRPSTCSSIISTSGIPSSMPDRSSSCRSKGVPSLLFGSADVNDRAAWSRFIEPQKNWVQQTFEHEISRTRTGWSRSRYSTPTCSAGTSLRIAYEAATLPRYIEWRMMGEGQYAVGIEPCTNGFGRKAVKEAGELIVLQPGERRVYRVRVSVGPSVSKTLEAVQT